MFFRRNEFVFEGHLNSICTYAKVNVYRSSLLLTFIKGFMGKESKAQKGPLTIKKIKRIN
jgi:hypothetical protein